MKKTFFFSPKENFQICVQILQFSEYLYFYAKLLIIVKKSHLDSCISFLLRFFCYCFDKNCLDCFSECILKFCEQWEK